MKRIRVFLIFIVIIAMFPKTGFCFTAGISEQGLDLGNYSEINRANVSDNVLFADAGGAVKYDCFVPFNAAKLIIECSGTGSINIKNEKTDVTIHIDGSKKNIEYDFESVLRIGNYDLKIDADKELQIKSMTFIKEDIKTPSQVNVVPTKFDDYSSALQTAVVLAENSSVMIVNGGRRYIDFGDNKVTPIIENGVTYLPIKALARALGYYYEVLPDKNYFLLRQKNLEYYLMDSQMYKRISEDNAVPIESKYIIRNGEYFLEFRYFASECGKYVAYRDGIITADYKKYVNDILWNDKIFNELKNEMNGYAPDFSDSRTYYVAKTPNASDDNIGSLHSPFSTLKKAAEIAEAGDCVIIREGVYREVLEPKNNGTASKPIVFKAFDGENVTISANEEINLFSDYKDGLVIANMDWSLGKGRDMLFYNNNAIPEARHPNCDDSNRIETRVQSPFFMTRGNIQLSLEDSKKAVSDTDLNQEKDFWKGGIFVTLSGWGWYPTTAEISSSDRGVLNLGKTTNTLWFSTNESYRKTDCGYITCTKNAIDVPGEWTVENGRLYMMPPEGETAKTLKVEMKKRQLVMNLENSQYIRVKNINTIGGSAKLNNSVMCVLDGVKMKNIAHYTFTDNQLYNTFDGIPETDSMNAPARGEDGVYIGGRDNVFINGGIDTSAGNSLTLSGIHTYVENNDFKDCGYTARGGICVLVNANSAPEDLRGGHFIYNNSSHGANRSVFTGGNYEVWFTTQKAAASMLPMEIAYNDFYNANFAARDTGIFYFHGTPIGSDRLYSKVHNNYVHDGGTVDGANESVYFDNLMQFFEAYDNLIYSTNESVKKTNNTYVQDPGYFPESFAVGYSYNNNSLNYKKNGIESMTLEDYPGGRPFHAGVYSGEYTKNYERIKNGIEADYIYFRNAEATNGAEISNANAVFSGNNQVVELKDVDMGDGKNVFDFYFYGDYSNTDDKFTIAIGDNYESADKYILNTKTLSPGTNELNKNTLYANLNVYKGKKNIYIVSTDFKSTQFVKVGLGYKEGLDKSIVLKEYAGNCTSLTSTWAQKMYLEGYDGLDGKNHPCIYLANKGTICEYKNMTLYDSADQFVINGAAPRNVVGSVIQLRMGKPDSEVLGEVTVTDAYLGEGENQGFKEMRTTLNKVLQPGTYDIYITFSGGDDSWTRLYWFALANSERIGE